LTVNTSKNVTFESIRGTVGSVVTASLNTLTKGIRTASNAVSASASVYGTHTFDLFESDTVGRIWWAMNEPTAFSNSYVSLTLATSAGGFTSGGQVAMPAIGDELIIETPYYILGHTGFANAAATITGTATGGFVFDYDIDVNDGNGFTGSYQTVSGANLSAETIDPALGFKLRLRVTCSTNSATRALTYYRINTVTTALAQDNLYPLDTANPTLELTGLTIGTTVVVFNSDYSQELDRETLVGTSYSYPYEWISDIGDFNVNILIWKDDKVPFITTITLGDTSQSIPLNQSDDLVYDSGYTNTHTIDFANELIILDSGNYNVQEVYSLWKDEILLTTNAQYDFAFTQVGGNPTGGANSIPFYTFLSNGWKIRPQEANGTTNVVGGILLTDDESDPFVDTLGTFTVRINYQQPVQAIAVSTGGGGGATASEVWAFATRTLSTGGVTAIQSGLATEANATTNRNLVQTDISALNDFNPATDVVARVTLVDTTTTNTDMRGTNNALLAASYTAPDNAGIVANGVAIAAIPTNPLLTNDARLDTLDATISSRLAAADYVAPDNAAIATIETQVDELHKIQGLDTSNPMTVTPTTRVAGAIELELTGDGETSTTVTRQ
jgi:hypothetical protein